LILIHYEEGGSRDEINRTLNFFCLGNNIAIKEIGSGNFLLKNEQLPHSQVKIKTESTKSHEGNLIFSEARKIHNPRPQKYDNYCNT
jgi:hypothetical protein